ncbi:MAG: TolC family protein [Candidatus Omnitrophota bacterium]|nr:TolC family protein [Candidatus Omnitrophota bacterium]
MKLSKLLSIAFVLFSALGIAASFSFSEEPADKPSEIEASNVSIMGAKSSGDIPESPSHDAKIDKTDFVRMLSLDECIDIAMKNNLPLRTVKKSVKLAQWRLFEARRNLLPKVGIKMEEHTGQIGGRRFYGKSTAVDLQQTLWHGGEFMYTMMQAQVNLKIVNREYARIRNELVLQVKKGYYTFAKAKENMNFQSELSRETSRIYDMVVKQIEAGVGSNLEFLNVSSQANQVRFQFVSAKGDTEVAELILKQAMNVDASERIDVEPLEEFKKIGISYENILHDALMHRPEMQINSMMIQYYLYEQKIAKAKSWPKIDFMGSFGMAKEEYISKDSGVDPATGTVDADQKMEQQWYAGVKCSIPLWGSTGEYSYTKEQWSPVVSAFRGTSTITSSYKFNFLDNLAQFSDKASADVDMDRARQELIKTKQDVTLEVKEACFNYEKALLQLETASNKMKYQEGDLELIKFRRQMDEAQDSNVIESMIKLAQEKFGYIQAISDCRVAIASINKAVGITDYYKDTGLGGNSNKAK